MGNKGSSVAQDGVPQRAPPAATNYAPKSSRNIQTHIDNAAKLGILQLRKNGLKETPAQLLQRKDDLRNLDLSENKIEQLPSFIGLFSNLKQLHIDNNRLKILPEEIGNLKKLETLSLSHNLLTTLPLTLVGMISLKKVILSNNHFTEFPLVLCDLPKLEALDLSENQIAALCAPGEEQRLAGLKVAELNLNRNRLNFLYSDQLAKCANLKILRVEENCLGLESFSESLLADSNISLLAYDGNLFQKKELENLQSFDKYQQRLTATRKKVY